jgi:vacuolar-type H+-ATPase subunit I/STV1
VFLPQEPDAQADGEADQAAGRVWGAVGYAWMVFFPAIGVLNLVMAFVVFKGNTSAWVNFKVFGITAIFFAFSVIQALMLSKHIRRRKHEHAMIPASSASAALLQAALARPCSRSATTRTCTPAMPARPPAAAITA